MTRSTLYFNLRFCLFLVVASGLLSSCARHADDTNTPPNIVLIVADDLGWNDVGYHGGPIKTPRIDRLAREGVELDRFYVAPVCSPTRAGLLTGRYPIRFGMMRSVVTPWCHYGLDPAETTIAEALEARYPDRGIFGKWHLGHLSPRWHPLRQGFTHFYGSYTGAIDYETHMRLGQPDWHLDYQPRDERGYATDLIADASVRFIQEKAAGGKPFFCYVPFTAPHEPLEAPEKYLDMYPDLKGNKRKLAAMITCLDDGIGRILDAIDKAGIRKNTIVWFLSDNGGIPNIEDNNHPFRGNKGYLLEGGIRVPACVRWPAGFSGHRRVDAPTAYIDVMPTLLQAARIAEEGGRPMDGVGLLEVLEGKEHLPQRDLYFYVGVSYNDAEQAAIITADWKLIVLGPHIAQGLSEDNSVSLYDIKNDPTEQSDVAEAHPDVVADLCDRLIQFEKLEPVDAIPRFFDGRDGFVPPRRWSISGD